MTTAILGRVWIEWPTDPAMPWGWNIYLEGSTKPMDNVLAMQISVEVRSRTVVDLRRMSGTERYELIAGPAPSVNIPVHVSAGFAQQLINNPPAGWSVRPDVKYSAKPTRMVADAIDAVRKKQVCDECGGSGWYRGLNIRQPCSRGCSP